jgi:hypothetical protein
VRSELGSGPYYELFLTGLNRRFGAARDLGYDLIVLGESSTIGPAFGGHYDVRENDSRLDIETLLVDAFAP